MKSVQLLVASALFASAVSSAHAQAPAAQPNPNAPVYVVSYIDIAPSAKAQAMSILKQFRTSCAREDGNQRCEAVQRMEQQNEFALLQVWKDQKSFQAHNNGSGNQLRERLKSMQASPYDQRVHTALAVLPPQPAPSGRVVYAITHIDVVPPRLSDAVPLLTQMAEASRKDQGNGRLEVLQQLAPRNTHFTLVEIWGNKRLLEGHQVLPRMIQYREQIFPMIGSPYDERLYKILD
jgi:quinol monooxygenase YgiN